MTQNLKHTVDLECSDNSRPSKISKIEYPSDSDIDEEEEGMSQNPRNGIQRYLVAIEYIGTLFSGSQKQLNVRTVVGALEEAFSKFVGQPVSVSCSSRTDAGVHALSNVCHVDIQRISKRRPGEVLPPHEPAVVGRAVNHFLQKHDSDLMVIDVRCVPSDFHARFKAQERTYFYRLLSGPEPLSTFEKDRAWHVPEELSLPAMQEACRVLVGCHDFSSFRAAGCQHFSPVQNHHSCFDVLQHLIIPPSQAKSPIRTLDELSVNEVIESPYFPSLMDREQHNKVSGDLRSCSNNTETDIPPISNPSIDKVITSSQDAGFGKRRRHRCLVVTARARSFLYHQVRLLVGVLKAAGTGNLTIPDVERILNAKTVTAASPMAPACGLYLGEVKYDLPTT
ncbi:tRNA pseudouridine synthase A [Glycine max]|nr:tRNA pseudouridine synthase A [Glycine max]